MDKVKDLIKAPARKIQEEIPKTCEGIFDVQKEVEKIRTPLDHVTNIGHDPHFSLDNITRLVEEGMKGLVDYLKEIANDPEKLQIPTPACGCLFMGCIKKKAKEAVERFEEFIKEFEGLIEEFKKSIPYPLFEDIKKLASSFQPDMLTAPIKGLSDVPDILNDGVKHIDTIVETDNPLDLDLKEVKENLHEFRDTLKTKLDEIGLNQLLDFFEKVLELIKKHGKEVITNFINMLIKLIEFVEGTVDSVREFCQPPAIIKCCAKPPEIIQELEEQVDKVKGLVDVNAIKEVGKKVGHIFDMINVDVIDKVKDMFKETDEKLDETLDSLNLTCEAIDKATSIPGAGLLGKIKKPF